MHWHIIRKVYFTDSAMTFGFFDLYNNPCFIYKLNVYTQTLYTNIYIINKTDMLQQRQSNVNKQVILNWNSH